MDSVHPEPAAAGGHGAGPPSHVILLAVKVMFALIIGIVSAASDRDQQAQQAESLRQQAEALFAEARRAVTGTDAQAAILLLTIAQAAVDGFPAAAAADATRAFELAAALPGGGISPSGRALTEAERANAVNVLVKTQIEPAAIAVTVDATQIDHAIDLARRGDISCDELIAPIIPKTDPGQAMALATECQQKDGTYPYIAIAARAYRLPISSPNRLTLVRHAASALALDTTSRGHSVGIMFIGHAWTCAIMPADLAERTIIAMVEQLRAASVSNVSIGAELIGLMTRVNATRAAELSAAHPEWETRLRTPNRTMWAVSDSRRSACSFDVLPTRYPESRRLANGAVRGLSPVELDRAIASARAISDVAKRVVALLAIAGGLVNSAR